jgi:hypothetical protein
VERGNELERRTTSVQEQLFYWIFNSITFSMVCEYELHNRVPNQDSRKLLFKKQIKLMRYVKPEFATLEHFGANEDNIVLALEKVESLRSDIVYK